MGPPVVLVSHVLLLITLLPPPPRGLGRRLLDLLARQLDPRPLVVGTLIGFLGCVLAGHAVEDRPVLEPFERFHLRSGIHVQCPPSPDQLLELARRRLPREKIAVIVGGTSVFLGAGQRPGHVWVDALRRRLGDRFAVLNLATGGGHAAGYGLVMARMLWPERERLIYVCDTVPSTAGEPDGGLVYCHLLHEARGRGLVPADAVDGALDRWVEEHRRPELLCELRLRGRVDGPSRFADLWSLVARDVVASTWVPGVGLTRRAELEDPEVAGPPPAERFRTPSRFLVEAARRSVEEARQLGPERFARRARESVQASFPQELRRATVIAVGVTNPYYQAHAAAGQADHVVTYLRYRHDLLQALRSCGLDAIGVGEGLSAAGFDDLVHLSEEGGEALAAELAPRVAERARALGYLDP